MEKKEHNWGVNNKLKPILKKLVKNIVAKEYRKDAMNVLTRCTDKTVREFLHFALLGDYNLACTCLDFGIDKNTNEKIVTGSFGGWLEEIEEISLEDYTDEKDEELLIELEDWDHTCGDGCCYTYGVNIYVNGEQIENEDGTNNHQLLTAVLNKLGYTNVRVEHK